ncbi:MAG: PAS domain S-box protein [Smithellaceae bacterium]|nr:PAS domain S-box protein [Smithellaceae bacterium]
MNKDDIEKLRRHMQDLEGQLVALKTSEKQYRRIFETARDGIIVLNYRTGRIMDVNTFLLFLLGFDREEMLGKRIWDIGFGVDREMSMRAFAVLKETGYIRYDNLPLRAKDGKRVDVEFVSNVYTVDADKVIQCNVRDISERVAAQQALAASETRCRELFNNMTSGVAVYRAVDDGADFVFVDMNRAGERISQVKVQEIVGRSISELFPSVPQLGLLDALRDVWQTGEPRRLLPSLYQDGRITQWVENFVFRLPAGEVVAIYDDVTDRKRLEEEILNVRKLESIATLAGGIAHDFNNLLAVILGNVSFVLEFIPPASSMAASLKRAERACNQARDLARQLITFSRGGTPVRKVLSLGDLLRDSVSFYLSGSDIAAEFHIADDLWPVEVDEDQIQQVIQNLTTNAKEAMPEGGRVTVAAENAVVTVRDGLPIPAGNYVLWSVTDEGVGIPEDVMGKIFDPFFSTKEMGQQRGMGMGLAICHSIIAKHDGYIQVRSSVGHGSTFTVYLPALAGET